MTGRAPYTVDVPVGDGDDVVRVQVTDVDESLVRVGRSGAIGRAERSLVQMLGTVRPVAESFVDQFRGMPNPPDEIAMEFGVSLSGNANLVIARTATQANFSVNLTWHTTPGADARSEGDLTNGSSPR